MTPDTPVRKIGPLPLATWEGILRVATSPMLNEVNAIVEAAGEHGAMALAQAYKESSLGHDATAQRTKNPLGIMVFDGSAPCEPVNGGYYCLRKFNTWADAFRMFRRIISDSDPPYDPEDISLRDYLLTYVGGPGCRQTNGQRCAPGNPPDSLDLYIRQTIDRINSWRQGTTPAPQPEQRRDPISVIVGGKVPPIDYGWRSDAGLDYYRYGVGHGTNRSTEHTGLDIPLACGTALYAPFDGVVDCVGEAGTPRWGQGCGAYRDVDGGGVGNLTILLDTQYQGSPVKLTLGHVRQAFVRPGDRVKAGQRVATVGSMNGCHVHVETSINRNGTYYLIEPRTAMGGSAAPAEVERLPFTEPAKTTTVTVKPGTKVYQRADPASPVVAEYKEGEDPTFQSGILTLGEDGQWWWVGSRLGRVRLSDTVSPKVKVG